MTSENDHSAFRVKARDWYRSQALHARFAWLAQLNRMITASGLDAETRVMLDELASFVGRVAIGATTPPDRERLERLHRALRGNDPLRVLVLELVKEAIAAGATEQACGNLQAMLAWKVDARFSKLEVVFVREQLCSRNSPDWIAFQLSSSCGAFDDLPPRDPRDPLERKKGPGKYSAARKRLAP